MTHIFLEKKQLTLEEQFWIMRMIFGGHQDKYDYHVIGLNFDFLCVYLAQAGFKKIQRVKDFGLFNDTSKMVFKGVPISVNVEAEKP